MFIALVELTAFHFHDIHDKLYVTNIHLYARYTNVLQYTSLLSSEKTNITSTLQKYFISNENQPIYYPDTGLSFTLLTSILVGASCSSVVRVFVHCTMGSRIDPSWWSH